MTTVRCPRCRDEVTLPGKASSKALVRCPLCLEEYLLSEAIGQVPPALIVVGGETDEISALGAQSDSGGEYQLAGVFGSSAPTAASVATAGPALRSTPRSRRKEKSFLGELVKVALGGVLGLSLGLLVLWWTAGWDELQLGPQVAKYVPWIVPAKLRVATEPTRSEAGTAGNRPAATASGQGNRTSTNIGPARLPAGEIRGIAADEASAIALPLPMPDLTDLLPNGKSPSSTPPAGARRDLPP